MSRLVRTALAAAGLLAFLGVWEALPRLGLLNQALVPPPSAIPAALGREVASGVWLQSVASSLTHYVQGRNPNIKLVATGGQMFPSQPGTVVAVTPAFAAAHPKEVQGLVDALVKADKLLKEKPDEAAPLVEAALGKGITDVATIRKALTSPASRFVADPRVIVDATAKMQDYQVSIGTLDKAAPLEGLFDPSYFEKSSAK